LLDANAREWTAFCRITSSFVKKVVARGAEGGWRVALRVSESVSVGV
jgi:hypothetical protein